MSHPLDDETTEPPLDPAMERVQAKLRRLLLVSAGTLGVGFLAVVFAVIYRVSNLDSRSDGAPWRSTVEIPIGSTLVATDVDGDRLAVTVDEAGGRRVLVFDLVTGRRMGETAIVAR
ncbi:MAG TPA: DUF6476 family protein [Methylomirabilota bacterium]|nr:DUF6476 family protein [Methylomirabilota bacterium]